MSTSLILLDQFEPLQTRSFEVEMPDMHPKLPNFYETPQELDYVSIREAFKEISTKSVPSILWLYVENLTMFLNVLFIGMLDEPTLLSSVGMGTLIINIVVCSIDMGLCGGIDTLVSQAFGRKDFHLWGTYLNTARIIVTGLFGLQVMILMHSESILLVLGQSEEVSSTAQVYIYFLIPGLFMYMQFEWSRRYLFCQGVFNNILYTMIWACFIHTVLLYLLVIVFDLRILGAAIATAITYTSNFLILYFINSLNPNIIFPHKFFILDKEAFKKVPMFLKFGVPAAIMCMMEWWAYEVISIYAGWLGVNELAATIIISQIFIIMFMNSLGITFAATSLVGNSLGSNLPNKAKRYTFVTILFGFICTCSLVFVLILFRNPIFHFMTGHPDVLDQVENVFFLAWIAVFFDLMQGVNGGMIRAMGYQNAATITQFIGCWLIMSPACYLLAFTFNFGYAGIWMGVPLGNLFLMLGYFTIFFFTPWERLAKEVSNSGNKSEKREIVLNLNRSMFTFH
jgi:multidrug resistance protein, MATE family